MAPRARIEAAPAMIILSKIVAVYVRMMNMPRAMWLVRPTPNASINPSATAAMMTTRAMPDGTRKVRRKSATINPNSSRA